MIRDPSDGSVKEKREFESSLAPAENKNDDEAKRLERAREWLRDWKSRNGIIQHP